MLTTTISINVTIAEYAIAIKTALISVDRETVNIMVLITAGIITAAVAYWHVKKR